MLPAKNGCLAVIYHFLNDGFKNFTSVAAAAAAAVRKKTVLAWEKFVRRTIIMAFPSSNGQYPILRCIGVGRQGQLKKGHVVSNHTCQKSADGIV